MNVFMITAPFQVLNAREAVHHFGFRDNLLIILDIGLFRRAQYAPLIDGHWSRVEYLRLFGSHSTMRDFAAVPARGAYERGVELYLTLKQLLRRRRLDRLARRLGHVPNLVLGSYRSDYDLHFRHFANHVDCDNVYVIDVGTNSLDFERSGPEPASRDTGDRGIARPALQRRTLRERLLALKSDVRRRFIDWDARGHRNVKFFSCYDVGERADCIRNEYRYLKSLADSRPVADCVWFLGESLVTDGLLEQNAYVDYVARARAHVGERAFVYVPHPREAPACVDAVARRLGCDVRRFGVPVEFALTSEPSRPRCLASFCSSALVNCAVIFGAALDVRAYYLPATHLVKGHDMIAKFYSYFASARGGGIEVVVDY